MSGGHGVLKLTTFGGALVAVGLFSLPAEDGAVVRVARFDGEYWRALGPDLDGAVYTAVEWNGSLVVGGGFMSAGGQPAPRIARWDGASWHAMGAGFNEPVFSLHAHDGQLVAGGRFTQSGATTTLRIAAWDGEAWQPIGPGFDEHHIFGYPSGLPTFVDCLVTYGGRLVAGGLFTDIAGGGPAAGIAQWDGQSWEPLGAGLGHAHNCCYQAIDMAVLGDRLYVGGLFDVAGGQPITGIAAWDGQAWASLGDGGPRDHVTAVGAIGDQLHVCDPVLPGDFEIPWFMWGYWTPVPTVTRHPADVAAVTGQTAVFGVDSVGAPGAQWSWSRDGAALSDGPTPSGSVVSGSRTPALTIAGVRAADSGVYRAALASECGPANSDEAVLTVGMGACPADWDGDQSVTSADVSAFLSGWLGSVQSGNLAADFNGDGAVNSFDISAFLTAWLQAVQHGC